MDPTPSIADYSDGDGERSSGSGVEDEEAVMRRIDRTNAICQNIKERLGMFEKMEAAEDAPVSMPSASSFDKVLSAAVGTSSCGTSGGSGSFMTSSDEDEEGTREVTPEQQVGLEIEVQLQNEEPNDTHHADMKEVPDSKTEAKDDDREPDDIVTPTGNISGEELPPQESNADTEDRKSEEYLEASREDSDSITIAPNLDSPITCDETDAAKEENVSSEEKANKDDVTTKTHTIEKEDSKSTPILGRAFPSPLLPRPTSSAASSSYGVPSLDIDPSVILLIDDATSRSCSRTSSLAAAAAAARQRPRSRSADKCVATDPPPRRTSVSTATETELLLPPTFAIEEAVSSAMRHRSLRLIRRPAAMMRRDGGGGGAIDDDSWLGVVASVICTAIYILVVREKEIADAWRNH